MEINCSRKEKMLIDHGEVVKPANKGGRFFDRVESRVVLHVEIESGRKAKEGTALRRERRQS
jgi:hypothetical protein